MHLGARSSIWTVARPHCQSFDNTERFLTLKAASTCSTTGSGQCSILHCKLWLMHPGLLPVTVSSNSQHELASRREKIRVLSHPFAKKPSAGSLLWDGDQALVCSLHYSALGFFFPTHSSLNISAINWCFQEETLPMMPAWGSTSMISQDRIFSHVYLISDLLLFHI